ncbi:MAG TPA: insulinase family protein, partial [Vicinamibacterales bacterium]
LADQSASPDVLFEQTLASALSGNHPRRQPETAASVAKWNLDTSLGFYKARFADASNFTFVFVGSFTLETIRPLIETYIASLPATHARETWRDQGVKPPAEVVQTTVRKGIAPKSQVAIVFSGPFEFTPQSRLALQMATLVLQGRLSDAIREQLGATYAISAESEASRYPRPEYRVRIEWTCDPAQVESLVRRVFQEVDAVRNTPLTDDQVTRIRDYLKRELDRSSQDNGYLLTQILRRYEAGEPLDRGVVSEQTAEITALTGDMVTRAAVRYFDPARYVQVTLMPDTAR